MAFGEVVDVHYRVAEADVIVSLDADFLTTGAGALRYARDFASRRRPEQPDRMNRFYAVECMPTPTGTRADHRWPLKPSEIEPFASALAAALGVADAATGQKVPASINVEAIAKDLAGCKGSSLVIAGESASSRVHALAHAMNETLGNVGRTVIHTDPVESSPVDHAESLRELASEMSAGAVDVLVIVGGNPVYTAPAELKFAEVMSKVPLRVHLSQSLDETSEQCHWHIPEAHFLETWSDARAFDGTVSIVQPLILPLYNGRSAHELIAAMSETPEKSPYDLVREYWSAQPLPGEPPAPAATAAKAEAPADSNGAAEDQPNPAFEAAWRKWLHDGVMAGSAFAPRAVAVRPGALKVSSAPAPASGGGAFEIAFRLDPCVLDGRFANNGWLQELPKPITKITWDNAVLVSPATAAQLGAVSRPAMRGGEHGQIVSDVVEIRSRGRTVRGALFPVPGHPDGSITVHLGYGRTRAGHVGSGSGFNAYALRDGRALWGDAGVEVVKTGDSSSLACTQYHHLMEGRGMVRVATRDEYAHDPHIVHEGHHTPPRTLTLYPDYKYEGYKWGMAIDVNACTGCNACIVGCQAENNIPVVGKDQVLRGREMHWLRVDSYNRGPADNPETYSQPVPCMQCENAPCETVCPVAATVHSHEGLNDMVYNRCVGTRYCANNCPYKVRRFNYHLYQDWETPSLKLGRNPDVTVRSRGVMEKCTYCVQRINAGRIDAEKEDRRVRDGDVKTACQQACPSDAIIFGDLNDPASRVSQLKAEARNYGLLEELNTRPRTTYLAAVRNLNPELGR
jgi:molybdopterin-containing oxidoreductase family iron-sulfur binding subunit